MRHRTEDLLGSEGRSARGVVPLLAIAGFAAAARAQGGSGATVGRDGDAYSPTIAGEDLARRPRLGSHDEVARAC